MKKALKFMMLMSISLTFIFFTSCENDDDETSNSPVVTLSKATISGIAYANLNLTNDTVPAPDFFEKVPTGTTIVAVIDVEDLITNPEPGVDYGKKQYQTTVQSDGSYTIDVDATSQDIIVTLKFNDFVYEQKVSDTETQRKIFEAADQFITVTKNVNQVSDVYYN